MTYVAYDISVVLGMELLWLAKASMIPYLMGSRFCISKGPIECWGRSKG